MSNREILSGSKQLRFSGKLVYLLKQTKGNFQRQENQNGPDLVDWLAGEMITHDLKPEIEAFDLSHIHQAVMMHKDGRIKDTPYIQFVMGIRNAMPADKNVFDYYIQTVKRLSPNSQWSAAGIGPQQHILNE